MNLLLFIFMAVLGTASASACGKADVAFLVDTSGSVNSAEWAQQASFTKGLVGGLNLGTDAVQYSLSVFGTSAKTLVNMTSDVAQVNALPFADKDRAGWRVGGSTMMDMGFLNAGQILDKTTRKVPKIVVMITDGVAAVPTNAKRQATALKSKGYTVMAILVGSGTSVKDVADYVSVPALQVNSFDALQSALASVNAFIAKTLCDEAQLIASTPVVAAPIAVAPIAPVAPPIVVTPTTGCGKADVAFLVDTSGSVNSAEWAQQASFTKGLVGGLNLGTDAVQYSLSVFGTSAKTLVPMTSDVAQVNALPFADKDRSGWRVGGSTAMDTGFLNAGQILDKTTRKVPKIVVMITDGVATSASRAKAQATALKSKGYTVMAILVGSGTSVKDVADYVSVPALQVKSFDALQSALASVNAFIAKTLCDEAQLIASIPALNANVPATPTVPVVIEQIPAEIVEATAVPEPSMPLQTPEPLKPLPTAAPTPCPGTETASPTMMPTHTPTNRPTVSPTAVPTATPTVAPTFAPTAAPTAKPSVAPTAAPTVKPTRSPTDAPTARPTAAPTARPSAAPTRAVVMTSAPRRLASAVTAAPVRTIDSVVPPAVPAYGTPPAVPAYGTPPAVPAYGTPPAVPAYGTPPAVPAYGTPPAVPAYGTPPTTTTTGTNAGYGALFPPPTTTTTGSNAGYGALFPPPTTTTTGTNAGYGTTGR